MDRHQYRLDFCFEFDLSYAINDAVNGSDAGYLGTKANEVYNIYPHLQFDTFLTQHDQDRVLNVLGFDDDKAKMAAGIRKSGTAAMWTGNPSPAACTSLGSRRGSKRLRRRWYF